MTARTPDSKPLCWRTTQEYARGVEGLEHDLRHALAVGLRVQRGLRQQHWVLLRGDPQLVVEGVVPDLLLRGTGPTDLREQCSSCPSLCPCHSAHRRPFHSSAFGPRLHVIPVGDDAVLDGVLQGKDTPLGLGLVTDVGILPDTPTCAYSLPLIPSPFYQTYP